MKTRVQQEEQSFFQRSFRRLTIAESGSIYVSGGVGLRIMFVGELADETNIFLDLFALLFHFSNIILASLLL